MADTTGTEPKKTRRTAKRTTRKTAPAKATEESVGTGDAPAKKRTRTTTRKAAATPTTGDTTPETGAVSEAKKAPAKKRTTRKTTAKKTTTGKKTGASSSTANRRKTSAATAPAAPSTTGDTDAAENSTVSAAPKKPKKTSRRRAGRTTDTTPAPAAEIAAAAEIPADATARLAAEFDRSKLGAKTRVHVLAKLLATTSKDLILTLDKMGLVKVAQSSLSTEEANRLLDVLAVPAEDAPETPGGEPVEKIRVRVEKNVANEIHQIEEKVDRELADVDHDRDSARGSDPDSGFDIGEAVLEERDSELLEDVVPAVTPAPDAPAFIAPVFLAPTSTTVEDATGGAGDVADADGHDGEDGDDSDDNPDNGARRKRRGRRGKGRGRGAEDNDHGNDRQHGTSKDTDDADAAELPDEPVALKGSTRLEAQRRRRTELREEGRKKRHVVSEAEFLARRESVERTMVVREKARTDHPGSVTQVGVLEDDLLVEHFVTSETQSSMVGNIYLGRVQNVLPSMEAAFIDIGKGRNGVLYAGEVDWKSAGLGGRSRRIEHALHSGDQVLVQITKDPVGHKGARLTTQISLAGRFLVYVPGGRSAGISRKLPESERKRLKAILKEVVPASGGAIIRTAAEGVHEKEIAADVNRLHSLWEDIQEKVSQEKKSRGSKPVTLYEEPDMLVKVVRDLFNEDFDALVVEGNRSWNTVNAYIRSVAPDLEERMERYDANANGGVDVFEHYRIDEQLQKALSRKVWLPSGGSLVIDRTEAMTVIDVNTGKFTGSGGNLEETVTRNNLEAAEEIVRQMRLRDMGGMIVVDFIDMVLPENQDLVLRRLTEALGRDRTRHQVSEVTSLGLVQMTRKKLGTGLLETFSTECETCDGRGIVVHADPVEHEEEPPRSRRGRRGAADSDDQSGRRPAAGASNSDTDRGEETRADNRDDHSDETPSIEELADAVVAATEEEENTDGKSARRSGRSGASRRGRRGGRRTGSAGDTTPNTGGAEDDTSAASTDDAHGTADADTRSTGVDDRGDGDDRGETRSRRNARGRRRSARTPDNTTDERPDTRDDRNDGPRDTAGADRRRNGEETNSVESIAAAAVALAGAEDPDEPSGADYLPADSYREALEAFEASPRRKRRTRGNSVSDHPPKRSDYMSGPLADEDIEEVDRDDTGDTTTEQSASAARRARRGGRRGSGNARPVADSTDATASTGDTDADGSTDGSAGTEGNSVSTSAPAEGSRRKPDSTDSAEPAPGRRGRRRVTKRLTKKQIAEARDEATADAGTTGETETPAEETSGASGAGGVQVKKLRRGRRRIVRRIAAPAAADDRTPDAGAPDEAAEAGSGQGSPAVDSSTADKPKRGQRGRRRVVRKVPGKR